jgi:hypothetical protein
MQLARLDNESNWKSYGPSARVVPSPATPRANGSGNKAKAAAPSTRGVAKAAGEPIVLTPNDDPIRSTASARPGLMDFPYPLRDDLDVLVRLPRDLTAPEAERLCKYIRSLARDDQAEG